MKKSKQLSLLKPTVRFFGGILLHSRRKGVRPLSTREPIHLVMRSSWAYGATSFLLVKNRPVIERLLRSTAKAYGIKVYRQAIVQNHLHLVIKIPHRPAYKKFIRVFSSQVASHVMLSQSFKIFKKLQREKARGDALPADTEIQGKGQAFWQMRPWTRVITWGRDFRQTCTYVTKNTLEALGFIPFTPRVRARRRTPI